MTIIDIHAHLLVSECLDEMRGIAPLIVPELAEGEDGYYLRYPTGDVNGPISPGIVDFDRRRIDMATMGIELQIVSVRPQIFAYGIDDIDPDDCAQLAFVQNEAVISVAASAPDVINAMLTLPLNNPDACVKEVERHAGRSLVRGVLVDSNIAGVNLDDPALAKIWAALEETDLPVFVHPYQADVAGMERMGSYYLFNLIGNPVDTTIAFASVLFGGVMKRHPKLRWCFAHGGGAAPYLLGRWDHGWKRRNEPRQNLLDLPSESLHNVFFDSIVHNDRALHFLGDRLGWQTILLGSDYPFDMGDMNPVTSIRSADISDDHETGILGTNAERFLRPLNSKS